MLLAGAGRELVNHWPSCAILEPSARQMRAARKHARSILSCDTSQSAVLCLSERLVAEIEKYIEFAPKTLKTGLSADTKAEIWQTFRRAKPNPAQIHTAARDADQQAPPWRMAWEDDHVKANRPVNVTMVRRR